MTPEATVASFILRFTQEHTSEFEPSTGVWRAVIRHVQTGEQADFVQMEDALAFIARYVDIESDVMRKREKEYAR
ncbi:MAG: hypothetical protein KKC18_01190 [Chloroflexi bacterium]|nr:hypothetical protein [Chloroflexota bacterium]